MTETTKTAPPVETVLAEIRDRYDLATPGNWGVGNGTEIALDVEQTSRGSFTFTGKIASVEDDGDRLDEIEEAAHYGRRLTLADAEHDAAFIAHAHEDVPRLLKAVEDVLAVAGKIDEFAEALPETRETKAALVGLRGVSGDIRAAVAEALGSGQ